MLFMFRLMEFFPPNKRTEEHFKSVFDEKGLTDIVKLHKAQVCPLEFSFRSSLTFFIGFSVLSCDILTNVYVGL